MKVVERFSRPVRDLENCWIPMSDGCRLAARIWMPENAVAEPVPAVLEYIPYRKRDHTRVRDEPIHRYFAGNGYAAVRVDLRGSGDSEGLLRDEYLEKEQDDGVEVIRWIAAQPWCSGAVGMMGKSWGGFNSLQVAARRPEPLKAILTVCSTDDRYADDAHYMGGCLLNENLIWGSVLFTINAQPPDPEVVGERWRRMWLERLENNLLFPELWLRHQSRDEYWKHGSVCEDFEAIACPVYAVGGWADSYTNAIPRLLAGLKVPRKGLVGPWAHVYPHLGVPGPAIGFLQEALRWWDHWLKGIDTGIMDEPMYRVWMQDSVPPRSFYDLRSGRWVAEREWPSSRIAPRRYLLNPHRLDEEAGPETRLECCSPQIVGLAAGSWCGFGAEGELPIDQREELGKSLAFESEPLRSPVEILGAAEVALSLSVDRPQALVAVRLNDVAPDGSSTRVTYGILNLTHRSSHEHPQALVPGKRYEVRVSLNDAAHSFPVAHRMRVVVSTCYWPLVWPSPEPVTLSLYTGRSFLEMPVRPPGPEDERLRPFGEPEAGPAPPATLLQEGETRRDVSRNPGTGNTVVTVQRETDPAGGPAIVKLEPIDLEIGHAWIERYEIPDQDPLGARAEIVHKTIARRGKWSIRVKTRTRLHATKRRFHLRATLDAHEGDRSVFSRSWKTSIPRNNV